MKLIKNIALGLVIGLALVFAFNLLNKHEVVDNTTSISDQQKVYAAQLKRSAEQIARSEKLYEQAENLQKRQEQLIEKWEKQARRIDAILTAVENKYK